MSREIHDNAPGSKLVMIPQAAHLSNLENPAAFTQAMQEFLAAH
jgi:pimeloyl-ACP methyl ester carboxylesterase